MPRLFAADQVREAASRVEKTSDHDLERAVVDALFKYDHLPCNVRGKRDTTYPLHTNHRMNVLNDLSHVNTGCATAGSAGGGSLLKIVLLRLTD